MNGNNHMYCIIHKHTTSFVESIFLGWQIVIKCKQFIVFLVSLECIKGVF